MGHIAVVVGAFEVVHSEDPEQEEDQEAEEEKVHHVGEGFHQGVDSYGEAF